MLKPNARRVTIYIFCAMPLVMGLIFYIGELITHQNQVPAGKPSIVSVQPAGSNANKILPLVNVRDLANTADVTAFEQFQKKPPSYLKGTDIRGSLVMLDDGSLDITADIRKQFDYFFIMTGDYPESKILSIIRGHLQQSLTEPALGQALALLKQYVAYQHEYEQFHEGMDFGGMYNPTEWAAEEIKSMRRSHLGDSVSDVFFAEEEALRDRHLEHGKGEYQSKSLDLVRLQQDTRRLRDQQVSEDKIQSMRIESFGEEAAERLAALDESRRVWEHKRQAFVQLKNEWKQVGGLSDSDKERTFQEQAMSELALSSADFRRLQALQRE